MWQYFWPHTVHVYFSYIMAVSFIGGGNQSTRRKPPTCRTLYHIYDLRNDFGILAAFKMNDLDIKFHTH